jgi:hypothetical protein
MKSCDDCKWCSVNFTPNKDEKLKYKIPNLEKKDARFYICMHPKASKGVRFDCHYCIIMRTDHHDCKEKALLFEDKEN